MTCASLRSLPRARLLFDRAVSPSVEVSVDASPPNGIGALPTAVAASPQICVAVPATGFCRCRRVRPAARCGHGSGELRDVLVDRRRPAQRGARRGRRRRGVVRSDDAGAPRRPRRVPRPVARQPRAGGPPPGSPDGRPDARRQPRHAGRPPRARGRPLPRRAPSRVAAGPSGGGGGTSRSGGDASDGLGITPAMGRRVGVGREGGFTMVEMIVVLVVLGVLVLIAVPAYLGFSARAAKRTAAADVRTAVTSAEAYHTDYET